MPGVKRSSWIVAALLGVAAIASLITVPVRADRTSDLLRPFLERHDSFDVFSPFAAGNPYLRLGLGIAFAASAVVVLVAQLAPTRGRWWAAAQALVAVAAGVYAQLQRDSPEAALSSKVIRDLGTFEGEVFQGALAAFDPFNVGSPYLWLGVAVASAVGALCTALTAGRTTPGRS